MNLCISLTKFKHAELVEENTKVSNLSSDLTRVSLLQLENKVQLVLENFLKFSQEITTQMIMQGLAAAGVYEKKEKRKRRREDVRMNLCTHPFVFVLVR